MQQEMRRDEVSDFAWMILELQRVEGDDATKRRMLEVIERSMAGRRMYGAKRILVRPHVVQRVLELLNAQSSVLEVRNRLIDSGIASTQATAYRLIQAAIALRGRQRAQQMQAAQRDLFGKAGALAVFGGGAA